MQVDMNEEWTIPKEGGHSRAGWTPFNGRKVRGRVWNVFIRGEGAYVHGEVLIHNTYPGLN